MAAILVRLPEAEMAELRRRAATEQRSLSNLGQLAIVAWLHGGAETYAQLVEQRNAAAAPEIVPPQVQILGAWLVGLPREIQVKLVEIGEGLRLLFASQREVGGALRLSVGTVQNSFLADTTPPAAPRPPTSEATAPHSRGMRRAKSARKG